MSGDGCGGVCAECLALSRTAGDGKMVYIAIYTVAVYEAKAENRGFQHSGAPSLKTAKIFQNGRSQAVRLPAEFRFDCDEVLIRRDPITGEVILSPKPTSLDEFLRMRDRMREAAPDEFADFMNDRDQGVHPHRSWP